VSEGVRAKLWRGTLFSRGRRFGSMVDVYELYSGLQPKVLEGIRQKHEKPGEGN
jgi:hypothetical protein